MRTESAEFWRKIADENWRLAAMYRDRAEEAEQFARDASSDGTSERPWAGESEDQS